jgi:uncharacterized membrane protein
MGMSMAQNFAAGMQQPTQPPDQEDKVDVTAELIKAKEWFDNGLITEEEYKQKRKELLKL